MYVCVLWCVCALRYSYSLTSAPGVLSLYCVYVFIIGLNGTCKCRRVCVVCVCVCVVCVCECCVCAPVCVCVCVFCLYCI